MKHYWFYLAIAPLLLPGCISQPEAVAPSAKPDATPTVVALDPEDIGEFTLDQLSGRGCGMTLWKEGDRTSNQHFVLFNGMGDSEMEMMLDGRVQPFRRVSGEGESFYGQQLSQTFESIDGTTRVTTEVTLGDPGEIESVAIPEGTLTVERGGEVVALPVAGDAGC